MSNRQRRMQKWIVVKELQTQEYVSAQINRLLLFVTIETALRLLQEHCNLLKRASMRDYYYIMFLIILLL